MRTRPSAKEDIPQLKALWKQAFGDEDSFIDAFFEDLYRPERCVLIEDEGRVLSMAYLLPCTLVWKGEGGGSEGLLESADCAYLYGMCTDEAYRGRGLGLMLLSFAKGYMGAMGCEAIALLPADEGLFGFYRKAGYELFFEPMARFDAQCWLSYPSAFIDFQKKMDLMYGEDHFSKSPLEVSGYKAMLWRLSGRIPDVKGYMAIALE